MTTPVPALSTSADVEAVRKALMASRLTWGVHADRWGDHEWQREFWAEAARIAVAALSTPPTEGTTAAGGETGAWRARQAAKPTPSVPGAVGAGSAVKALADDIEALCGDNAVYADFGEPPNEDVVPGVRETDLLAVLARHLRIAQDAARTGSAEDWQARHRDLVSRLGFGDNITEPMADNDTIVRWFEEQSRDARVVPQRLLRRWTPRGRGLRRAPTDLLHTRRPRRPHVGGWGAHRGRAGKCGRTFCRASAVSRATSPASSALPRSLPVPPDDQAEGER